MSLKHKFFFIFLSIITIGIYPLIVFTKKQPWVEKKGRVSINLNNLSALLGKSQNIISATARGSKVKFEINDHKLVDSPSLKKLRGVSGVFVSSKSVSIIVGPSAPDVAKHFTP